MKHLPILGLVVTVLGGLLYSHASWASGEALHLPGNLPEFLLFSAQGYLGVDLGPVDKKRASALHLNDAHAAEVVMVDHDAPAGKSGLKEHDVILQLDGQAFENADQLRHRLREMPSGRTVTLLISRDGNIIHVTAQLCDRAALQDVWSQHFSVPEPAAPPFPGKASWETFLRVVPRFWTA